MATAFIMVVDGKSDKMETFVEIEHLKAWNEKPTFDSIDYVQIMESLPSWRPIPYQMMYGGARVSNEQGQAQIFARTVEAALAAYEWLYSWSETDSHS
ncbi:MAG TPA: hypothetical protein VD907_00940 [Verrucomicrobiae bacterium]|nr:hypothetical protein [Verrucomicrobiae bacterium]